MSSETISFASFTAHAVDSGILRSARNRVDQISLPVTVALVTVITFFFILSYLSWRVPALDSREPPLVKPRVPYIGHVIGAFMGQHDYVRRLWAANKSLPIVTAFVGPIKFYAIFDPVLQHSVMRSSAVEYDEYPVAIPAGFGIHPRVTAILSDPTMAARYMDASGPMQGGDSLRRMELRALGYVAGRLNKLPTSASPTESLYTWLRDAITMATAEAFFGDHNPYRGKDEGDMSLVADQWAFETAFGALIQAPTDAVARMVVPGACAARDRVHAALVRYYAAGHDAQASEVVRCRAAMLREAGLSADEFGPHELTLMHGGTSNSAPTLFWVVAHVYLRPDLVAELRAELDAHIPVVHGVAELRTAGLEAACPLLANCVRESLRLTSQWIGWRSTHRAIEIPAHQSPDGRAYLLKKGVQVIIPAGVAHRAPSFWLTSPGDSAVDEFDPYRFLDPARRKATSSTKGGPGYIPFGGGPYLCPGRAFANQEIVGFLAALVLGFDIVGLRKDKVKPAAARLIEVTPKPAKGGDGGKVEIRRRSGWEQVKVRFVY